MKLVVVVNGVRGLRASYTSTLLALAAVRRGHAVGLVSVDELSYDHAVTGRVHWVEPTAEEAADPAACLKRLRGPAARVEDVPLAAMDVVLLRNNPLIAEARGVRFNPALELGRRLKEQGVLVLNDPDGLRRAGTKMYLSAFPASIRPKTLITCSLDRVRSFLSELRGSAIIKPLQGFGGQNVFLLERKDRDNWESIVSTVRTGGYFILQEYVAAAARGDKRVLLVGGVPLEAEGKVAVYRRLHAPGELRNNIHAGGSRRRCVLTPGERELCELVRPRLVADGLYFVGLDIAGDKILEINVFSPGGIHNMNELYKVDLGDAVIADLERRMKLRETYHEPIPAHVFMRG
jgi:glutathione synthase